MGLAPQHRTSNYQDAAKEERWRNLNTWRSSKKVSKPGTSGGTRTPQLKPDLEGSRPQRGPLETPTSARLNSNAFLYQAHLENADLSSAHLERADLKMPASNRRPHGTHLNGAHLEKTHLNGAHLNEAPPRTRRPQLGRPRKRRPHEAHLEHAHLFGAHLELGQPLRRPPRRCRPRTGRPRKRQPLRSGFYRR